MSIVPAVASIAYGEEHKKSARVDVLHQEGADETAAEEHSHRDDVIELRCSLVDAETVSILDDESPHHDLSSHIEKLCQDTFAIDLIREETFQSTFVISDFFIIMILVFNENRDDDKDEQHHAAEYHVRISDDV